jgi:hypothetical protein
MEDAPPKRLVLQQSIHSTNKLRIFCFKQKRSMILSPTRYLVACIGSGFLIILPILISLVMVYEKIDQKNYDFSPATVPLLVMASFLLFSAFVALCTMTKDLFMSGCLTWHRDSLGMIF